MIAEGEKVEQTVHWCGKEKLGWYPDHKPVCKFVPRMSVLSGGSTLGYHLFLIMLSVQLSDIICF